MNVTANRRLVPCAVNSAALRLGLNYEQNASVKELSAASTDRPVMSTDVWIDISVRDTSSRGETRTTLCTLQSNHHTHAETEQKERGRGGDLSTCSCQFSEGSRVVGSIKRRANHTTCIKYIQQYCP